VTTPSAKADGFLGHARTIVPRYVPNAQSERTSKNITGGVDITVNNQPAVRARVNTVSKRFRNIRQAPASGADLRSPVGVYPDKLPTSVFCFVGELGQERTPTRIVDRTSEHTSGQRPDIQILDSDKAIGINQLPAEFMLEVRPLISDVSVSLLEQSDGFSPADTAPLAAGHLPLTPAQLPQSHFEIAGVSHQLAIRQGGEGIKPHIDADSLERRYHNRHIDDHRKAGVPLSGFTLQCQGLNFASDRPVHFHLDDTDPLYLDPADIGEVAAVSPGRERVAIEPIPGLEAGIARFPASLHPAEESLEGLVNPPEHVLAGGVIGQLQVTGIPYLLELVSLVVVVKANSLHPPCLTSFLESRVIQGAGFRQLMFKGYVLLFAREKPVFESPALHLFTLLLLNISSHCFFADMANSPYVVAPRPQGGQLRLQCRELSPKHMRRISLKLVNYMLDCLSRFAGDKYVDVVGHDLYRFKFNPKLACFVVKKFMKACCHAVSQNLASVFRTPHQVILDIKHTARGLLIPGFHAYKYIIGDNICQESRGKGVCRNSSVA